MSSEKSDAKPEVLQYEIKTEIIFAAKRGSKFTAHKFAKESGLEAFYMRGVKDKDELARRHVTMYRLVHELIKIMRMSRHIEYLGVDTLEYLTLATQERNGGRGKLPKVYKVLNDISFRWEISGRS